MAILTRFIKFSVIYLLFFVALLLVLGTFTVELVIRSIIIQIRATGWLANHETSVIIAISVVLLIFTSLFAKWLSIWYWRSLDYTSKVNMFFTLIFIYGLVAIYWLFPRDTILHDKYISHNGNYIGGSYPDSEKIASLRLQGYTGIISLLDPIVLPQEPILIQQESDAATEYNMPVIRIPMLPGGITNLQAEKMIRELVRTSDNKKYYVHAYYGSDRVKQFIDIVNSSDSGVNKKKTNNPQTQINKNVSLSRGGYEYIDNHLVIAPKPTDTEFSTIFNNTPNQYIKIPIKYVISVNPDDRPSDNKSLSTLLKSNHIEFIWLPISRYPYDPAKVLDIANQIKKLDGGVFVYSYFMPPESITLSGLIESYQSNLPALPKALFENEAMSKGKVTVLAPNIITGPNPTEIDVKYYLKNRGIKGIYYLGNCDEETAIQINSYSKKYALKYDCKHSTETVNEVISNESGPWYVFGPNMEEFSKSSAETKQMPQLTNLNRDSNL